jgi:endonuclease YncB( thermonuclease family)
MIPNGMAWQYLKYSKSEKFARAEAIAKKARVGIWSQEKRIAPWDYRNGERLASEKVVNAPSTRTTERSV